MFISKTASSSSRCVDLLALDDALRDLAAIDPRRHDVVQLSYFGGLILEEIAAALDISIITVRRDLKTARIWLLHALRAKDTGSSDADPSDADGS